VCATNHGGGIHLAWVHTQIVTALVSHERSEGYKISNLMQYWPLAVMLVDRFLAQNSLYLIMTFQVDILNPKATKLLQDLADLKLISIRGNEEDGFLKIVNKLRAKAANNPPSLEEITKEVESVRAKRYAKQKK